MTRKVAALLVLCFSLVVGGVESRTLKEPEPYKFTRINPREFITESLTDEERLSEDKRRISENKQGNYSAFVLIPDQFLKPEPIPSPVKVLKTLKDSKVYGVPTWYCLAGRSRCTRNHPDQSGVVDLFAAAGPSLRIGDWRGRVVEVCAKGRDGASRCLSVQLIDWCACGGDHFLDLYWDAWNALGKPSWATVSWAN